MAPEIPFRILFRTWAGESAGTNSPQGFRSGDQNRRLVTTAEMVENFENHIKQDNLEPTFFISTTDDPMRALRYAIDLDFRKKSDVQIAIIRSNRYISGEEFATALGLKPYLFRTEFLFQWDIGAGEVMHVVSLDMLVHRGLYNKCNVLDPDMWPEVKEALPSLGELRLQIYENNKQAWRGGETWPERSGRYVAAIANCFGCEAPLYVIASLIWERGTHFEPANYWHDQLNLCIKYAIQEKLNENFRRCVDDEWYGELA